MWLPILDKKRLINLDYVEDIYAEPLGQGSVLIVRFSSGKTLTIREFKAAGDAESVLRQFREALGNEILKGTAFDH